MLRVLLNSRRDSVDQALQTKLFNFLRFALPKVDCKRVLSWQFWPPDLQQSVDLAASCLFEVLPFSLAFRVMQALVCALLLSKDGKHEHLAAQIRSGHTRACLALRELSGECGATAVLNGNTVLLSTPPKLFVTRDCDVAVVSARLEGAVCFFAVPLKGGNGQLCPGVRFGSLGEGEYSAWLRLYDVHVGRDTLLKKPSLTIIDQMIARAAVGTCLFCFVLFCFCFVLFCFCFVLFCFFFFFFVLFVCLFVFVFVFVFVLFVLVF